MKQIHLNYFYVKGEKYKLKTPLKLDIKPLSNKLYHTKQFYKDTYWICDQEEPFDILIFSPTQKLLKRDLYDYMEFIYEEFAMEEDSKLAPSAKRLKYNLLENTYKE